ncbi:growth-regulating factor 4 [Medicago truncatula]|nr:growth-regulating factor 4 [Medicago truncatula]
MEAKPLQLVPSSHNSTTGGGPQMKIENGEVDEEKRVVVGVKEDIENKPLITEAQRRELDHQVFIFNHFAYNLPLPYYLLQFPSNMSEYSRRGSDYVTMVDQEPHRCRRTDGKKWRCGKDTVPNQKYCERHMHRGRNRSRKLVETSQLNSPLKTNPSGGGKSHAKLVPNIKSSVSNPNPLIIHHNGTFSYNPRTFCVVDTSSVCDRSRHVIDYGATAVTTSGSTTSVSLDNRVCPNVCKQDEQIKRCITDNVGIKSGRKGSISCESIGISTGIGFSPKSVLPVSGCNDSYLNNRNNILEPEPGRCRRTDGKKWRCKSAVLPGQKYCATHMHRGAKRRFTNLESPPPATTVIPKTTDISSAVTIAQLPDPSAPIDIQKANCWSPSTKLSMSVQESAPFVDCNEKSVSSGDTDGTSTTITDTMNECSYLSF